MPVIVCLRDDVFRWSGNQQEETLLWGGCWSNRLIFDLYVFKIADVHTPHMDHWVFVSVRRVRALPLAAVGHLRVGERQWCCGDTVRVFLVAHRPLWPAPQLGWYGSSDRQHISGLLSWLIIRLISSKFPVDEVNSIPTFSCWTS